MKDYICDTCGKSFSDRQYLKLHVKTVHEGVKDHKCDTCGKSFSRPGHLNYHIKTGINISHENPNLSRIDSKISKLFQIYKKNLKTDYCRVLSLS